MKVFVVVVPHDYQTAEIVGVYTKRRLAENVKANTLLEVRPATTVQIQEVTLEG